MKRVAITGVGAISCIGCNREQISNSLYRGLSGVSSDSERRELGFRSSLTGMIRGFEPRTYVSRKAQKTMTLSAIQGYAASMQAIEQADLDLKDLQNEMTGLIFGCDSSCLASYEQALMTKESKDTGGLGSGYIFQSMTSNITMNLNVLLKTRGACWTISSACSSSGHAVGQAAELIRNCKQTCIICGGVQEINWQSMCGFDSLDAFSVYDGDPRRASRPFSVDRDGLVPSGGAAALVLEDYDIAKRRNATILGEVCGYGFSSDGSSISVPEAEGMKNAMQMGLKSAQVTPEAIDYICAHATSTPVGDTVEAMAIHSLFGDSKPRVSSLKGMCGHELWMAGAGQVVYTTLMAIRGFTAPNINFSGPDEDSRNLNILTESVETPPTMALCNSAGFGGTNSSLVVRYEI